MEIKNYRLKKTHSQVFKNGTVFKILYTFKYIWKVFINFDCMPVYSSFDLGIFRLAFGMLTIVCRAFAVLLQGCKYWNNLSSTTNTVANNRIKICQYQLTENN